MAAHASARRSDAFANISQIIDAAKRVFAAGDGADPLSRIAKEAGVGVATLYRHFPNRQALARSVYEQIFVEEVEPLLAQLGEEEAPRSVLLDVAERVADIVQRERGLVSSIGNLAAATSDLLERRADQLDALLRRAQAAGAIRTDIEVSDIPRILAMVIAALAVLETDAQTRRRSLDLMLDAFNPARSAVQP
jgi:AcrR family transcriptional regulator